MANVPLRAYIREIEMFIDRGNTDEAIAHCRHILSTYPKHLDAYRMLGKASLESKRYNEAADVFKRVLLVAPDDFVSHVGMSIIYDDQKRLEDTIWHMERAFEVQPSNSAVQAELQRLYGQRDGREPHKIRLTRGALAHMYVQGELYSQAIGEIRSVLAEDPGRFDMLALLAFSQYRSGQKADASESCSQLLNKSAYCLVANQILVEILPGTGMAETIPTYRNRVIELDPYAAHAPGHIFQAADAPDNAVMIQRLEYSGQPASPQVDWRDSLANEPAAPPSAPEAASSDAIPDWMRQHGWGDSSGTFNESASSASSDSASEEIERAELPDWIRSMAPAAQEPPAPAPAQSEQETREFLDSLGVSSAMQATPAADDWLSNTGEFAAQQAAPSSDPPDWLASLSGEPAPEQAAPPTPTSGLGDLGASAAEQDAAMLWLEGLAAKQGANTEELITDPNARTEQAPEWVEQARSIGETPATSTPAPASGLGDLGTSAAEQDAAMLWLEGLAAKQGANTEELITDPNARTEQAPEWVEQARAIGETQETAAPLPSAREPGWPPVDDTGDFTRPNAPAMDETSVWLRKLDEADTPSTAAPASGALPESWLSEAEAAHARPVAEPASDADGSLESWFDKKDTEQPTAPIADLSAGWGVEKTAPASPSRAAEGEAEIPSWLHDLEKERESPPPLSTPVAKSASDLPAWLVEQPSAEPLPPAPTRSTEWVPASRPAQKLPETEPAAAAPQPVGPKPAAKPKAPRKKESPDERAKSRRGGILPPMTDTGLEQAREILGHGKIPDALQAYASLIRKGKLLDEITFDLKEALYRFPVEVSIWQTLGDAYMRSNRLQDALDAYTKAEELLR
ncbi:MAG: hypothetical protein HFACDABA_01876 [Anaerolineales bacterium]|nr:hypothetical protein [Anaerolineales bacterium]